MNGAFEISGVGLVSQQQALDTIAGNIANINTTAYKRADVRFIDLVAARSSPDNVRADLAGATSIAGVAAHTSYALDEDGEIIATARALDLAISGRGFIELQGARGETLLWRGGALSIDEHGFLTGPNGAPLAGLGALPVGATSIVIDRSGSVSALDAEGASVSIGQISLIEPASVQELERRDAGVFAAPQGSNIDVLEADRQGAGAFVQGALERSNVDLNQEMVQLMIVQRAFSANAQILQAADQMMAIANGLRK